MEKKISPELLHDDGLAYIRMQIGQFPVDESGKSLYGHEARDLYASKIKHVMGWSHVTVEEARKSLNDKKGPHLDEVLAALDKIEEENRQKD